MELTWLKGFHLIPTIEAGGMHIRIKFLFLELVVKQKVGDFLIQSPCFGIERELEGWTIDIRFLTVFITKTNIHAAFDVSFSVEW